MSRRHLGIMDMQINNSGLFLKVGTWCVVGYRHCQFLLAFLDIWYKNVHRFLSIEFIWIEEQKINVFQEWSSRKRRGLVILSVCPIIFKSFLKSNVKFENLWTWERSPVLPSVSWGTLSHVMHLDQQNLSEATLWIIMNNV